MNRKNDDKTFRFIFGGAKCGKSAQIREMIKKEINAGNRKIILLIPEQSSFENEREMLRVLGADKMEGVLVLSFTRLCDFVFSKIGGFSEYKIDDSLRALLMGVAIKKVESLGYKKRMTESEMINLLLHVVKEFKSQNITSQMVKETCDGLKRGILKDKLLYVLAVAQSYQSIINEKYADPLDDLTRLKSILNENHIFDGYTVFIDSFIDFTAQQMDVISALLSQCKDAYVSLCIDGRIITDDFFEGHTDSGIFGVSEKTAMRINRTAKNSGFNMGKSIVLGIESGSLENPIVFLEQNIFRSKREIFSCETDVIEMYTASSLYDECDFVAKNIKRLIMTGKYRYKDFAVIMRDTSTYDGIMESVLRKYDIPYFMDKPKDIESKALVKFIFSLLDIVRTNFSSQHVLRYIKCGLLGISLKDVALLENYILLWGIDKEAWLSEFTANPDGFASKITEYGESTLSKVNEIRKRVLLPLIKFKEDVKGANGRNICILIYNFLEQTGVLGEIAKKSERLKSENLLYLSDEEVQVWNVLMGVLEQMTLVLDESAISLKEFSRLLKIVISMQDISFIPHGLDEVRICAADRMVVSGTKISFVIGTVFGNFPKIPESEGLFSFSERKRLMQLKLPMCDFVGDLSVKERYFAYKALVSPKDKLFVTFSEVSSSGEPNKPSEIIKQIKHIIPESKCTKAGTEEDCTDILSKEQAFECCGKIWNINSAFSEALKEYFNNQDEYKDKMMSLQVASGNSSVTFRDTKSAEKLFGKNMHMSASKLESFYLCKFGYFCKYGLRAKEKKEVSFDSLEYGNLMHFLLENILSSDAFKQEKIQDSELSLQIDSLLKRYMAERMHGMSNQTSRFRYLFFRISKIVKMLIKHILRELSQSEFKPVEYEFEISERSDTKPFCIKLCDGTNVYIEGKVDRLDLMEKDGKKYVRIVDYKTGSKSFRISDILYGINMQMLIYLLAICGGENSKYKDFKMAGALYMPAKILPLDINITDRENGRKISGLLSFKLRMDGIILEDEDVIRGMEKEAKGEFIPATIKNGEVSKKECTVSAKQMQIIEEHIKKLVKSMAQTLKSGDIGANPVCGDYNVCDFCPYSSVCGHEGSDTRNMEELTKEEIFTRIIKNNNCEN